MPLLLPVERWPTACMCFRGQRIHKMCRSCCSFCCLELFFSLQRRINKGPDSLVSRLMSGCPTEQAEATRPCHSRGGPVRRPDRGSDGIPVAQFVPAARRVCGTYESRRYEF